MCKHCERLVEDVDQKPIVHAFMEAVAKRIGVPADRISVRFEVDVYDSEVSGKIPLARAAIRMLNEMDR